MTTIALSIDQYHIYTLRCAAAEWLQEHPEDPNAPAVRSALIATNSTVEGKNIEKEQPCPTS